MWMLCFAPNFVFLKLGHSNPSLVASPGQSCLSFPHAGIARVTYNHCNQYFYRVLHLLRIGTRNVRFQDSLLCPVWRESLDSSTSNALYLRTTPVRCPLVLGELI